MAENTNDWLRYQDKHSTQETRLSALQRRIDDLGTESALAKAFRSAGAESPLVAVEPHYERMTADLMKQGHSPAALARALEHYQEVYRPNIGSLMERLRASGEGAPRKGRGEDTTQYNAGG
jgi:hypothetical protein